MAQNSEYPQKVCFVSEANKKACKRFSDALAAFEEGNFELALRFIQGYRGLVRYDEFFCRDGRTPGPKKASVVVVAYSTGQELIACVNSVLECANAAETETIVIDNGKNADVLPLLLSMPILYVKAPMNFFPSEGRNIGAALAVSPLLFLIDDDALATPSFCSSAFPAFEDASVLGIGGKALPKNAGGQGGAIAHGDAGAEPRQARVTLECVCAWRRKEYLECGGMDPLLFGHEGEEFSLRLLDNYPNGKLLYWPDMLVQHDLAESGANHQAKSERHKRMSRYFTWKRRHDLRKLEEEC